ncbi:lycopene cyclase domain-containing protein [bacterium]|nr:lycopene cyclase domain-containing protein [bacterium]
MDIKPYFYFIGTTIFLPIWILLFVKKENRKDMLLVGILAGIMAIIADELYSSKDYWNPVSIFSKFPFESFYYGFIFGGIGTEFYELVFGKRNSKKRMYSTRIIWLLIFAIITVLSFVVTVNILGLNSVIACLVAPLINGVIVAVIRKDLFIPQLWNGLFIMTLTFIMFQVLLLINSNLFSEYWMLENLSQIFLLNIPLEEYLFGFFVGFGTCNLYEFLFGYSIVKN